jgi:hypothetical protein
MGLGIRYLVPKELMPLSHTTSMKQIEALTVFLMACTLISAGCIGGTGTEPEPEPTLHNFLMQDHVDNVQDDNGMVNLSFDEGGMMLWTKIVIDIIDNNGDSTTCSNPGPGWDQGDCWVTQYGGSDEYYWENFADTQPGGEYLHVTDEGANFCDQDCSLTVRITYDNDVVGQNIVHLI